MKNKKKEGSTLSRGRRTIIIAAAAFLGAVLLFGSTVGILALVRSSLSAVSYRGITMGEGVVNYLAATYKTVFIRSSGAAASDSESFWQSEIEGGNGKTYGEALREGTESYIRSIAVRAYLFDRASGLTSDDRESVAALCSDVLEYRANGSREEFNGLAEPMGFDYSDFSAAVELIYKANRAQIAIYGEGGSTLSSSSYTGLCREFLAENYSRVKILFIRTENEFLLDEDGNRVTDGDGNDELRPLTDGERAERQADISEIRRAIDAIAADGDGQMSPEYFDTYLDEYGYYPEYADSGFYLFGASDFTTELASSESGLLPVVSEALAMQVGEYSEVECDFGVCFIYRCAVTDYAYLDSSLELFFEDFYSLAASSMLADSVAELAPEVTVKDYLSSLDLEALPYNWQLVAIY